MLVYQQPEYKFCGLTIPKDSSYVLRGGEIVSLTPKAVRLLITLIERRERLVAKEELLELIWPNVTVEDANVAYTVSMIRRALGPGIVETVSKLGYRFAGILEDAQDIPVRTNLSPRQPSLIGREADLSRLAAALLQHPLVTVVGPPGVGKTSLAKVAARRDPEQFDFGVWFLEVSGFTGSAAIAAAIGARIGIKLPPASDLPVKLAESIGARRMMLILDGCEASHEAAAFVAATLLHSCSGVSILATSRRPLQIADERVLRLAPLSAAGIADTADQALRIPAVAMFVRQAQAADSEFLLSDFDAPRITSLCRALDGLPLALELVAARVPAIGIDILQDRLREVLLPTHSPVRRALDVSWGLLSERERSVLASLSVFAGSFDFGSALAVLEMRYMDLVDSLSVLIDNSLIVAEGDRSRRYRLLDTVRSYLCGHLGPSDQAQLQRKAACNYATRMTLAEDELSSRCEAEWREEFGPDIDNIRAALDWAFSPEGDLQTGLILAGRSSDLWRSVGLYAEGQRWLEQAVAHRADGQSDPGLSAAIWRGIGSFLSDSDPKKASHAFSRAAGLYRAAGDFHGQGRALAAQGMLSTLAGAPDEAERHLLSAEELLTHAARPRSLCNCLGDLAFLYVMTNRQAAATRCLETGLRAARELADPELVARLEFNLAELDFFNGNPEAAVSRAESAIEDLKSTHSPQTGWGMLNLALYLEGGGHVERAREVASEALAMWPAREDEAFVSLVELIALLWVQADPSVSASLIGWTESTVVRRSRPRQPAEQGIHDRAMEALDTLTNENIIAIMKAEGGTWTGAEAIEAARRLVQLYATPAEDQRKIIRFTSRRRHRETPFRPMSPPAFE